MNYYLLLKFVHVSAVIVWAGGSAGLGLLLGQVGRDQNRLRALAAAAAPFTSRVLAPAAGLTVLTGLGLGGLNRAFPLWMAWGLIAGLFAMVLGARVLTPGLERLAAMEDDAEAALLRRRIARLGLLSDLILLSVVAVMVLKPTW